MEIINFLGKGTGFSILLTLLFIIMIVAIFLIKRSSLKKYTGRIAIPLFFIELSVLFGIMALGFPDKGSDEVGPGVVPGIWIISILCLGLFLFIRGILKKEEEDPEWGRIGVVFIFMGMTIAYVFFMQIIGYTLATFIYLLSSMYFLTYRNWKVMISLTVGWILFSYFTFYKLLYVPLPKGLIIERIFG